MEIIWKNYFVGHISIFCKLWSRTHTKRPNKNEKSFFQKWISINYIFEFWFRTSKLLNSFHPSVQVVNTLGHTQFSSAYPQGEFTSIMVLTSCVQSAVKHFKCNILKIFWKLPSSPQYWSNKKCFFFSKKHSFIDVYNYNLEEHLKLCNTSLHPPSPLLQDCKAHKG
jgi:hypothetical protein